MNEPSTPAPPENREVKSRLPVAKGAHSTAAAPEDAPDPESVAGDHTLIYTRVQSGPLPPPEQMQGYADVYPDLPREIVAIARSEQEHFQAIQQAEQRRLDRAESHAQRLRERGQWFGFAVLALGMGSAIYCASVGSTAVGVAIAAAMGVSSAASVFITGKNQRQRETPKIDPSSTPPQP
jgi:uncharacterized membrane protein